jgi:hypothetical protein
VAAGGAFCQKNNSPSSNFVGLDVRSPKQVFNCYLVSLGVSNRTVKKAKWLGGKLKKLTLTQFYWDSSPVLIGV